MHKIFKKASEHKRLLLILVVALLFFVFVAFSRPLKIIDKSKILMHSSSKQYNTRLLSSIRQIVVHHSASIGQTVEDYARYHVQSKGWAGIGYHFVIEVNGDIVLCHPLTTISYNVAHHNTQSIGICLSGDFTRQEPSPKQLQSLRELIAHLRRQVPQKLSVSGHRDHGQTSCPGPTLYKHLSQFQ